MSIFSGILRKILPLSFRTTLNKNSSKETHINRALRRFHPNSVYLEIGVRHGASFRKIMAKRKIGIDPYPLPEDYTLSANERFYQVTSDDFFKQHAEDALDGNLINVALVDGMHEFTQALRDILNLEKYISPDGFILIHDCNPKSQERAEDYSNYVKWIKTSKPWNGDVWKCIYYLQKERPDLKVLTLDCDFGVGVVYNFSNMQRNSASIKIKNLKAIKKLDYGFLNNNRKKILKLRPPWFSWVLFHQFANKRSKKH